ncbi:pKID domain [Popillia japonica]|uniref:PKID domain n=1 Tax=Popillia japonica TaxID=7064 RepID=A0AAW1JWD5_POPJA
MNDSPPIRHARNLNHEEICRTIDGYTVYSSECVTHISQYFSKRLSPIRSMEGIVEENGSVDPLAPSPDPPVAIVSSVQSVIQPNQQSVIQTATNLPPVLSKGNVILVSKPNSVIQTAQANLQTLQVVDAPSDDSFSEEESPKKRRDLLTRRPSYRKILNDLGGGEIAEYYNAMAVNSYTIHGIRMMLAHVFFQSSFLEIRKYFIKPFNIFKYIFGSTSSAEPNKHTIFLTSLTAYQKEHKQKKIVLNGMNNSTNMRQRDLRPAPSEIQCKGFKFLITDRPSDQTIQSYLQELKRHNVTAVVRVCEPSYQTADLQNEGINVYDLEYDDGTSPPNNVVDEWFKLLKKQFHDNPDACVAVHCVAGLGRAPVMVALALIELGLKYEEAVELIREKRRGAINAKQLGFLEKYRPKSRLKQKNGYKNSCCVQ